MRHALLFAIVAGCAQPAATIARPLARGECTSDAHCRVSFEQCVPPGVPVCGGAVEAPVGECPPDRPHRVYAGCRESCAYQPARTCTEGFVCEHGAICRPDAPDRDARGCVHRVCASDAECGEGRCVSGRCYDGPGRCEMIPAKG